VDRVRYQSSNVIREFSRFAHKYDEYNIIQAKVAKTLVGMLEKSAYNRVLDVGCGSGEIYKNCQKHGIKINHFIALDSAQPMLDIHPSSTNISKICRNFNAKNYLECIQNVTIDVIISSSALQWSNNLIETLEGISRSSKCLYAAIFTSGTFKTLHKSAGVTSPVDTAKSIEAKVLKKYTNVDFILHNYTLKFETTRDMFRYIKQSGVSSGERKLSYKKTKQLMKEYPLDYLEFEVLFVKAKNI
jgi:malonyl-CoA O-methyltransferase